MFLHTTFFCTCMLHRLCAHMCLYTCPFPEFTRVYMSLAFMHTCVTPLCVTYMLHESVCTCIHYICVVSVCRYVYMCYHLHTQVCTCAPACALLCVPCLSLSSALN